MQYIVKTFHGLEDVLVNELIAIGASNVQKLNRAVSFDGDLETLYTANLQLRTALRILKPFLHFKAGNEKEMYQKIRQHNWPAMMAVDQTFAIDSVVYSETFTHSKYVALKVKDAIVDRFRDDLGTRPSINTHAPDLRFHVHVAENNFSISIDSSGTSLHQRGYRNEHHQAPLNEALAAGMLLKTGWTPETPLYDPMCGSGTLLIEAAMMARNIPPRPSDRHFAFMNWPDYDDDLWEKVLDDADANINNRPFFISGSDTSEQAIGIAESSLQKLGLKQNISIRKCGFQDAVPPFQSGIVIMNPPYGQRLKTENIIAFYQSIGDQLKQAYSGFDAWVLSANKEALKHLGLRPSEKHTLFNGSLECKFQKYSLYVGSKKRGNTSTDADPIA